jgi:hypothetical protein
MVTVSIPTPAPCRQCGHEGHEETIVIQNGPMSVGQLIRGNLVLHPSREWDVGPTLGR